MSKAYRGSNADQDWLLSPSQCEWLPQSDLIHFILDLTKTLDLSAITDRVLERGRYLQLRGPPYRTRHLENAEKEGDQSCS